MNIVLKVLAVAFVTAAVIALAPDVRRYVRITRM
jgi:hypothetical protein